MIKKKDFIFEKKHQNLLPAKAFIRRILLNLSIGIGIIIISLGMGMLGYVYLEGFGKTDAFVNAAMILSGMGPIGELKTDCGKVFAGIYALYCGIVFLVVIAIIIAPIVHRSLHKFLIEDN